VLSLALVAGLALFLLLAASASSAGAVGAARGQGFYDLFPHGLMVGLFAPVFAFVVLALGIGVARFWRAGRRAPLPGRLPPRRCTTR
jgi:citrate/tricarballylate utilization protein